MKTIRFNKNPKKTKYFLDEKAEKAEDEESVEEQVDKLIGYKKLDEGNPLERAKKFEIVKKNPPKPGFMKVGLYKSKDSNGIPKIVSKNSENDDEFDEDPFFTVDPYMLYMANITACPSNVVPMLIEQAKQSVLEERKIFRREKRTKEFPWGWIIIGLSLIPGILLLIYWMF